MVPKISAWTAASAHRDEKKTVYFLFILVLPLKVSLLYPIFNWNRMKALHTNLSTLYLLGFIKTYFHMNVCPSLPRPAPTSSPPS